MNRIILEDYKRQLVGLQEATAKILVQIEKELAKPERKTTARKVPGNIDFKRLFVASGFFTEEEAEGQQAKGLYTFLEYYSEQISEDQLKGIIERVLDFKEKGKVREKVPYLKGTVKNYIKERGGEVL